MKYTTGDIDREIYDNLNSQLLQGARIQVIIDLPVDIAGGILHPEPDDIGSHHILVTVVFNFRQLARPVEVQHLIPFARLDRKSTRLNSSHVAISSAVFCLKKKTSVCR